MVKEIDKLNKCNVSSAIQQNVLMVNQDVSVLIRTILNKHYADNCEISAKKQILKS